MISPGSHGNEQQLREYVVKVRMTPTERKLITLYAHRQGKTIAGALRSAVKAEIRRHKKNVEEFAELLHLDDKNVIDQLSN